MQQDPIHIRITKVSREIRGLCRRDSRTHIDHSTGGQLDEGIGKERKTHVCNTHLGQKPGLNAWSYEQVELQPTPVTLVCLRFRRDRRQWPMHFLRYTELLRKGLRRHLLIEERQKGIDTGRDLQHRNVDLIDDDTHVGDRCWRMDGSQPQHEAKGIQFVTVVTAILVLHHDREA